DYPVDWSLIFILALAGTSYFLVLYFFKKSRRQIQISKALLKEKAAVTERALQSSHESLEQLVHVAAHDLKAPLRSIIGFSQLIEKEHKHQLDATGQEYFKFIFDSGKRMNRLIDDLLTYSQATSQTAIRERVDLNDILDEVKVDLTQMIQSTNTRIQYGELPIIRGHKVALRQLFQNLLQNSIKYKSDKSPEIKISCADFEDAVEIALSDNGKGIPENAYEKIFNLFYRQDPSNTKPSGTGMGLAICKVIMEKMDGKIRVSSEIGKGSTFFLTFPK
ncbi:MAG: ATP-binding protein, partial [Bacteroidota bacterium]